LRARVAQLTDLLGEEQTARQEAEADAYKVREELAASKAEASAGARRMEKLAALLEREQAARAAAKDRAQASAGELADLRARLEAAERRAADSEARAVGAEREAGQARLAVVEAQAKAEPARRRTSRPAERGKGHPVARAALLLNPLRLPAPCRGICSLIRPWNLSLPGNRRVCPSWAWSSPPARPVPGRWK
jgi:hypothetical protein